MADVFKTKVLPIMDKVRDELSRKQVEEMRKHSTSLGALLASAAGPDGGMAATAAYNDRLKVIGEWNSKTVDDYIDMVKAELKRQHITINATIEKQMIDHLVAQQMPKSTADYILRKAAEGSIFYIPQRTSTTSLQDHINKKAEEKYDPSLLEEVAGNVGSWIINAASTWGFGGFFGQAAMDGGTMAAEHYAPGQQDKYHEQQRKQAQQEVAAANKRKATVPKWMLDQMGFASVGNATDRQLTIALDWATKNAQRYRSKVTEAVKAGERTVKASGKSNLMSVSDATFRAMQYEAFAKAIRGEQTDRKNGKDAVHYSNIAEADEQGAYQTTSVGDTEPSENSQQSNTSNIGNTSNTDHTGNTSNTGDYAGWNNLMSSMGFSGMGDTFNHLGLTLAMLPDMLVGVLTGKTKSIGLNKQTMMPLAALIGGAFIKNPLLKIPMMLYGGASLFNTIGQESLADYRSEHQGLASPSKYKRYADESLNARLRNPQIEGNVLLVDMDNVPRLVTLPQSVIEAYEEGALTVNTIANHVLAKADQSAVQNSRSVEQTRSVERTSQNYEQSQEREQVRGIR